MNDSWGRRFFKAGAVWLLLLGMVHSTSLFQKPHPANETERQLLDLMNTYHFNLMGSSRTMSELVRGFSASFAVAALAFGLLDLFLSRESAALLKRVAVVNALWLATMIIISLVYFFVVPTFFLATALLIFIVAWVKLPRSQTD